MLIETRLAKSESAEAVEWTWRAQAITSAQVNIVIVCRAYVEHVWSEVLAPRFHELLQ
jgi:hypothetical protein